METYATESTTCNPESQLDPPEILNKAIANNRIGELQEYCVKNKLAYPEYSDEAQWPGANNTNVFRVTCTVADTRNFGTANSKMNAKKIAAMKVLEEIRTAAVGSTKGVRTGPTENEAEPVACGEVQKLINDDENSDDVSQLVTILNQTTINSVTPSPAMTDDDYTALFNNMATYVTDSSICKQEFPLFEAAAESGRSELDPPDLLSKATTSNRVGELQEYCVKNKLAYPEYSDEAQWPGPNNTNVFRVTCSVGDTRNVGTAITKMNAKKIAALKVLEEIRLTAIVPNKEARTGQTKNAEVRESCKEAVELINENEEFHDVSPVVTKLVQSGINPAIALPIAIATADGTRTQLDPSEILSKAMSSNRIGELQEYCVKNKLAYPEYTDDAQWAGANNTSVFRVTCTVGDTHNFGTANSKMNAKKIAALKVLEEIRMPA